MSNIGTELLSLGIAVLLTDVSSPAALFFCQAVMSTRVYWSDKQSGNIYAANKDNGHDAITLNLAATRLGDVHIVHPSRQALVQPGRYFWE